MKRDYKNLFKPLKIKNMTLKNRVMMMPMGSNYGQQNGEMSFLHIQYYVERAKGGVGLIMVENASVDSPEGSNGTSQIRIDHDSYMPRYYKFSELVHSHGGCLGIQINHAGSAAMEARTGMQPVSASNIPAKVGGAIPRPLTVDEIHKIAKKFGEAAKRAQISGFDCVEIHAGHSYLISQFLSPLTNDRTDEFGGSPENRARFAKLVIDEVRAQVGPMFPIFLRISAEELMEGGNTLEDCLEYLEYLQEEVDVFDVSCALSSSFQYQIDSNFLPDGWRSYMAKAVKEKFGKPCVTMGNIRNPKVAEEILERGDADLIGIGRGLIADPHWVSKIEKGHEDDIRKCISCNIGCAGNRIGNNRPIRCTVNPEIFYDDEYRNLEINKQCNVVVIGGGTTGLEAACTAAEVGCTTFLIEKNKHLGGLAYEISKIPDKKRLRDFPDYLEHRASKLDNLFIFKGVETNIEMIKPLKPNVIVNATGANPLLPNIKGLSDFVDKENSKVQSIIGMINNLDKYATEDLKDKKVVVIGGGAVGLDVVEYFAPKGSNVSIVEMNSLIGADLDPVSKASIKELIAKNNVTEMPNTMLKEVKENSFVVEIDGKPQELEFDYGFVCLGMKAYTPIFEAINEIFEDENVEIMNIGDSLRGRRIIDGVVEARNILTVLKNADYL